MASVKFVAVSRGVKEILEYVTNREKTNDRLITGVNCLAQSALEEFQSVKNQFRKNDGRAYYHIVQAFSPDDPLDFDTAHEIGMQFAEYFAGFQCVVATHMNTNHIHNHIIMNSVNFENGKKYHQSAHEMALAKEFSNQLCQQHGLSITEVKADKYDQPLWKKKLKKAIRHCMGISYNQEDFVHNMELLGYGVDWPEGNKYMTYTVPEGYKCRDRKLFDKNLSRDSLEHYFYMGGCEYLREQQYVSQITTVDSVVSELASIFDALFSGDEKRFHEETIHHSEEEIELMLRRGLKISHTETYSVQDEEEEFEEYHGFSMTMM